MKLAPSFPFHAVFLACILSSTLPVNAAPITTRVTGEARPHITVNVTRESDGSLAVYGSLPHRHWHGGAHLHISLLSSSGSLLVRDDHPIGTTSPKRSASGERASYRVVFPAAQAKGAATAVVEYVTSAHSVCAETATP